MRASRRTEMKRLSFVLLIVWVAGSVGCATKNYVKNQTTPLVNKVNELDDVTAQNTKAIHDTDARAQAGIQKAQSTADSADQQALAVWFHDEWLPPKECMQARLVNTRTVA